MYSGNCCKKKDDCHPFEAKVGFAVGVGCGKCENVDLLKNYVNCEDWFPVVDGLVSGIGSKYWLIGDQVFLNINLQFVAQGAVNTVNMTGLPLPIKSGSLVSNNAVLVDGFSDPVVLVEDVRLVYNGGDLSSLDIVIQSGNLVEDNVYTLNAQIVYPITQV